MVSATAVLCARKRLTTKMVNKGYYRGNRVGALGRHTRYGGYVIDYTKVRHYNCPDLTDFDVCWESSICCTKWY